jgi:hypothetical protein
MGVAPAFQSLPVKVDDKTIEKAGLMEGSEIWISFRRTLILFRRILNSFHASWRLERGAAWTRFGVAEKDLHPQRAKPYNSMTMFNLAPAPFRMTRA